MPYCADLDFTGCTKDSSVCFVYRFSCIMYILPTGPARLDWHFRLRVDHARMRQHVHLLHRPFHARPRTQSPNQFHRRRSQKSARPRSQGLTTDHYLIILFTYCSQLIGYAILIKIDGRSLLIGSHAAWTKCQQLSGSQRNRRQ